jgi:hypothetical protein
VEGIFRARRNSTSSSSGSELSDFVLLTGADGVRKSSSVARRTVYTICTRDWGVMILSPATDVSGECCGRTFKVDVFDYYAGDLFRYVHSFGEGRVVQGF